jgi:stage II sporulation protein D
MPGVPCDWCNKSKYYRWSADLEDRRILDAAGLSGGEPLLRVAKRGVGDRALLIEITTSQDSKTMLASEFRIRAGPSALRSTRILSARRASGAVHLEGAGWGHGVGLCQMGAIGQADAGRSGREIAQYYYPGADLRRGY